MGRGALTFFYMFILIQGLYVPAKIFVTRHIEEYPNVYQFRRRNTQQGLAFRRYTQIGLVFTHLGVTSEGDKGKKQDYMLAQPTYTLFFI